jgi:hypothetical protein
LKRNSLSVLIPVCQRLLRKLDTPYFFVAILLRKTPASLRKGDLFNCGGAYSLDGSG